MTTIHTTPAEALDTLKRISVERYEQDGGTTYECLSDAELVELLEQNNNNPEEAWDFRVRIYQAQREVCAAYDNDEY